MLHKLTWIIGLVLLATTSPLGAAPTQGLVLHLDAQQLQPSERVALWKDISGKSHDVKQADAAKQPKVVPASLAGKPVVVFSGGQFLDGDAVLPEGQKALTIAAVWKRDATGGGEVVVEQAGAGPARRASLLTSEHRYGFNGESNDQHELMNFEPGEFVVSILRLTDDGTVTLVHNGAKRSATIDIKKQNLGTDRLRVGAKVANGLELLHGAIGEILIYDQALVDSDTTQLAKELSDKWKIPLDPRDPALVGYAAMIRRNDENPNRFTENYRPQYHYTAVEGWINDPNGLCFFNGEWHFFFQHHAWGHAISDDLLHWQHLPPAILPDEHGEIWSGSAVVDWNDTSGFFGGKPGMVCIYTYMDPHQGSRQSQAIAYSADGLTFHKYEKNPVIPQLRNQPGQPDEADFRDPKVFWHKPTKQWIMVVAGGTLRFYSSPNLRDWKFESINSDIQTECPDFAELAVDGDPKQTYWVLSMGGNGYRLGKFDGHTFKPETGTIRFNFGKEFYASQIWNDVPDGRCIMSTWLFNWGRDKWPTTPFSGGTMTLPYELSLKQTSDGPRVYSTPVKEVEKLRGVPKHLGDKTISPETNLLQDLDGKSLEIVAEFELKGASSFGFKVPKGGGEETIIGYRPGDQKMFVDRRRAGFSELGWFNELFEAPLSPKNNRIKLRVFVDWSSVEVFGNDGAAVITSVILPDPKRGGLELYAEGGDVTLVSVDVYPIASVWRASEKSP